MLSCRSNLVTAAGSHAGGVRPSLYRILLIVIVLIVYGSLYPWEFHSTQLAASPLWVLVHSWPTQIDRSFVAMLQSTCCYTCQSVCLASSRSDKIFARGLP